ncbi:phage holin family protein [Candidatus Microgenomates bacterium]|nr:phage holin family protein [Candidatus Microgenomates bacterium]
MLRVFLLRLLANSLGLWIASRLIPGVEHTGSWWVIIVAGLIFSVVNALIRPIIVVLSLPAIIVTLGLFTLIINSLMLYLVTVIYPRFTISTFTAALLTVIIVWLVNYATSALLEKRQESHA